MSEEQQPTRTASSPADDFSRRHWLPRLGGMVVLADVSGLVQNSRGLLLAAEQTETRARRWR